MDYSTLNEDQIKAYKSLERAIKKCEKSNVLFYTVLDKIYLLNGNDIECVENRELSTQTRIEKAVNLDYSIINTGFSGFADDSHVAIFRD